MNTVQVVAKLKTLAGKAGQALFERAQLAAGALTDQEWVIREHEGNPDRARRYLEEECFPELTGFGLDKLLVLLKTFPNLEDWRAHHYNLARLWAEHTGRRRQGQPRTGRASAKVKDLEEARETILRHEAAIHRSEDTMRAQTDRIRALEHENLTLRAQVARLEGQLEELRRENADLRRLQGRVA